MDIEQFKKQMRIHTHLRQTKTVELRRIHKEKFAGSRWDIKLPRWMHRDTIIRRLFYLYCYKNYHYPDDHEITIHFKAKADQFLDPSNLQECHKEDEARRHLDDLERFSKRNILSMPINNIDRYLASMNLHLQAPESVRRRVLWEMFNLPQSRLIQTNNARGHKVRRYRRGRINNKFALRDLLVQNPSMTFPEFKTTFGEVMPTVTAGSYKTERSTLRKAGYDLEYLKPGPAQPMVVTDEDGISIRGRLDPDED